MNDETVEKHYRIAELAAIWNLSSERVRLLVKDEPDVIALKSGKKRAHDVECAGERRA